MKPTYRSRFWVVVTTKAGEVLTRPAEVLAYDAEDAMAAVEAQARDDVRCGRTFDPFTQRRLKVEGVSSKVVPIPREAAALKALVKDFRSYLRAVEG